MSSEESDIESNSESSRRNLETDSGEESQLDDDDERPIQIIKIERTSDGDENLHLNLNLQQLNKIMDKCGDRPLCIICAVGSVRTGKSFLLNSIKEGLQAAQDGTSMRRNVSYSGFQFKSGYSAVTKGIWMWSRPFVLEGEDEEVAVLLMDTEGISDEFSKPDEIAAILGLSLLSSSILILNFMGDLTRPPFTWLSTFTKDGRKQQKFQKLSILVHDWTRLSSNRYGDKGGRKLLDKFLNQNSDKCGKPANAFEELNCFLLPHIGEKALQQRFTGQSSDLSKEFAKYLQKYTTDITDPSKLPLKQVLDTEITAKEFKHFFIEYVSFFNNPAEMELGPRPESISALIRETAGKIKISRGLDEYHDTLKKRRRTSIGKSNYMRDQDMEILHTQAKRKALQAFKTFSLPSQDEVEFERKFDQEITKLISDSRAANENERKTKIQDNIEKAYERLKEELQDNFPFKSEPGSNIPDNLVFYDNSQLDAVIEETKQLVDDTFFEEFAGEDDDELEDLRRKLDANLQPLVEEYRNRNIENRERANQKGEETVIKFLEDYVVAMQKKIKRLPKLDEPTLLVFHDSEMEKVESKFENMKLGTPDFKQQWKDDLVTRIEEELETMKLNLESTMAEALQLINQHATDYQHNLKEEANDMEEDEILAYHEDKIKSLINKFATVNPYPPENPKYDDVESRLKRKLQETYEKVVEEGILIRRKEDEKLEHILESSCNALKKELEDAISDTDFLYEGEAASTLGNAENKAKSTYEEKLLQSGADHQRMEEERAKFQSKTKKIMDSWERENDLNRDSATAQAEKILKKCTDNYESRMGESVKTLNTKDELLAEHENTKEAAIQQFQDECNSKNSLLVGNYIQKLESNVNEMSAEIEEHFDMIQKQYDVGLRAALFDAKSYYQEKMDKMFEANKQGYFTDEDLRKKDNELYKGAIKSITDHKPNKQQKQKLEQQLKDLFLKYKQKNATIKASYDTKNVAIGIDLGTTYCCVAAYHMGKVTIIRNTRGSNITPSYVTIKPDHVQVVGDTAKEEAFRNPEHTIFDAKRMIGRRLDDEKLQSDMKYWPFTVEEKDGKAKIKVHEKHYLPEQISAMILKHLKREAEEILRVDVKKAVITVPAYFTDGQRQATIDAGELAGLEVLGILNEPTAAAVAYRLEWQSFGKSRNILVYDLGGGTFDVAILKISDSKMDVLTVNGDSHLGGEDFDKNMMQYCAEEFKKETGIDLLEGKDSAVKRERDDAKRWMRRLQGYCENAKKALATAPTTTISVDEMYRGHDLSVDVSRKKFEELNAALFAKTITIVDEALKSAELEKDEIDDVVLVGGSTRIRRLQEMLEKHFNGKAMNKSINPDEAVAYGAAVQAAILNANPDVKLFDFGVIQEVTPMSLGIEIVSGEMDVIIAKNTKFPTSQKQEYRTHKDGQTTCSIRIFQGEELLVKDNKLLGNFVLSGIPKGPAGKEIVDVTMNINNNGILSVEAMCRSTKGKKSITVSEEKGRLTKEEKRRLLKEDS